MDQALSKLNRSGYRGVAWDTKSKKWRATYKLDGKSIHLGIFEDVHDAGAAVSDFRLQNSVALKVLRRRGNESRSRNVKRYRAKLSAEENRAIALKGHAARTGLLSSNVSGYKGVSWNKKTKRWQVVVRIDGKRVRRGSYKDVHEAGRVAALYAS